jgi:hypothetical protein
VHDFGLLGVERYPVCGAPADHFFDRT